MTYKQIEQCRETRLWIKEIVSPVIGLGVAYFYLNPEAGKKIKEKFKKSKDTAKSKIVDISSKIKH